MISKFNFWRTMVGGLLIVLGLLGLLQGVGILPFGNLLAGWMAAVVFAAIGLAFLTITFFDRNRWWAVIPGLTMLGLSVEIAAGLLSFADELGGMPFLGSLGLAFMVVYLLENRRWWAIIPAGTLFTLAIITMLRGEMARGGGGLLFVGLGLTFGLVALLPNSGRRKTWAWIPAGILLGFGSILSLAFGGATQFLFPMVIIMVGLFLVYRTFKGEGSSQ